MSTSQSRVNRSKEGKKKKKVKIVVSERTAKFLRYAWFPTAAILLLIIGLQIGVYLITKDELGKFQTIFNGEMWSGFFKALRNF